jgi:hypothetical protein
MVERTDNFAFELIEFDKIPWHERERDNWRSIDAVLARFVSILNFKGIWQNATAVVSGDRYVDPDLFTIWEVDTSHTTPSAGLFAADRIANVGRWSSFSTEFISGGAYVASTAYTVNTFLVDSNRYGVTLSGFTSTTTYDADVTAGNILTLIDLSIPLAAADVSADAAAASAVASAASAASTDLPASITANAFLRANAGATTYESILAGALLTAIGGAARGANSDITSITGLTTDLAITHGGTGASTAAAAATALGVGTGSSPQFAAINVGAATDTTITRSAAGIIAVEGVLISPIGQHTIWVPAGAMEAAVTTAPATSNAVEIGTSLFAARTMDFVTGSDNFCYFGIQMPKSWDAQALILQFVWSATGTTANTVAWAAAATSLGNEEVLTTAFPTATVATADTNSTTADDLMISAETSVTVVSSPTAEDYVIFEISRDVSADTLAEDARLHGIKIHYTIGTGSDT